MKQSKGPTQKQIQAHIYYYFARAVDCNPETLESIMDYIAPPGEQRGCWIHAPHLFDPPETYRACYKTLQELYPESKLTIAQHIHRDLEDKKDSTAIMELTKTLSKYLQD